LYIQWFSCKKNRIQSWYARPNIIIMHGMIMIIGHYNNARHDYDNRDKRDYP
jgi:hypothetical protein